jgi:hypothetical protein
MNIVFVSHARLNARAGDRPTLPETVPPENRCRVGWPPRAHPDACGPAALSMAVIVTGRVGESPAHAFNLRRLAPHVRRCAPIRAGTACPPYPEPTHPGEVLP